MFTQPSESTHIGDRLRVLFRTAAAVAALLLLGILGSATSSSALAKPPQPGVPLVTIAQVDLPPFVDLPQGAAETYPGSGLYKAPISDAMAAAVNLQTQENWDRYHIAKESNLGLPLGSVYLKAQNGKYVELALYERAAFTFFHGKPARQILSTIIFEGKIQVTEDEFIKLPDYTRNTFAKLYIAGEGNSSTPAVGTVARLLSTDKSKATDAAWTTAGQMLNHDGNLDQPDTVYQISPLSLGQPDDTTGHRVPDIMASGLTKLFGEKVVENAGLPLSPAVWTIAKVNGQLKPVALQVFQRAIVTYNPANDEANRVQVGLGGAIVSGGLTVATAPTPTPVAAATPAPTPAPTETPKPAEGTLTMVVPYKAGVIRAYVQDGGAPVKENFGPHITAAFDTVYDIMGYSGRLDVDIIALPVGALDDLRSGDAIYPVNGKRVVPGLWRIDSGRENTFYYAVVDMEEEVANGTRKGIIYTSIVGDPANVRLLQDAQGDGRGEWINYVTGLWLLVSLSHSPSYNEFRERILRPNPTLYAIIGIKEGGQDIRGDRIPFKLTPPNELVASGTSGD